MEVQPFAYMLPHVTISVAQASSSGRPKFVVHGKELVVEEVVREYLHNQGWWVVPGEDASLFLSVLACNFQDSFFADVLVNHIGSKAPVLIKRLEGLCKLSRLEGRVSPEHLNVATDLLCRYYSNTSTCNKFRRLSSAIASLPQSNQVGLIRVYSHIGYFTKGIPDLFASKPGNFLFTEVKSAGDALRSEQYFFAEVLLREVGEGFQVVRVLDSTRDYRAAMANPADVPGTRKPVDP